MKKEDMNINNSSSSDSVGIALLIIFFWGKPDLCDALIHWLMK